MKVWILALFIALTLTACGGGNDSTDATTSGVDSTTMTWDQDSWNSKNWE